MIGFIKRAPGLGFALRDIDALLHLARGRRDPGEAVAEEKIADLDRRLGEITAMRDALACLAETCHRPRDERACPSCRPWEPMPRSGGEPRRASSC